MEAQTEIPRIFITAQAADDPDSFGVDSWGVRPAVKKGDRVLFYVAGQGLSHVAITASDAEEDPKSGRWVADLNPSTYFRLSTPITVDIMKQTPVVKDWNLLKGRPFTDLYRKQPDPLEGDLREKLISLIESKNLRFSEWLENPNRPRFWVTVGILKNDPYLGELKVKQSLGWAVPEYCKLGDGVFMWVSERGFLYLFSVVEQPVEAGKDQYGPKQAGMKVEYRFDPPLLMEILKKDRVLKEWHLVKRNMQGAIQSQMIGINDDPGI